jgi:hypothetical protein
VKANADESIKNEALAYFAQMEASKVLKLIENLKVGI